jgi:hypothetical protein
MTAVNGERPFLDGMLAAVTGRTEQDAFGRLAQSLVTAHSCHLSHLAGRVTVVEVQRFGLATTGATAAHRLAERVEEFGSGERVGLTHRWLGSVHTPPVTRAGRR